MKFRYLPLLLFQICTLSLFGMSPEERTAFKAQLKAARTSQDIEQVIQARLGRFPMDKLLSGNGWKWNFENNLYRIDEDWLCPEAQGVLQDISPMIEDCIFEELYALLSGQAGDGEVNIWLEKYSWTDMAAPHISVGFTAKMRKFLKHYPDGPPVPTDPEDRFSTMAQYERDEFLLTKTRLLQYGNPEYIRSREQDSIRLNVQNNALLVKKSKNYWIVVAGLTMSAVLGEILYKYWWQDDQQDGADEETIHNNDAQAVSVNTK